MSSKLTVHEPMRPTRRTMVRSAAWSVPVVAVAATAPAYAASCGNAETLSWSNYTDGTVFSSAMFGSTKLTLSQSGNLGSDSGKVLYQDEGGVNPALRFYPTNGVDGSSITVTLTFSRAVKNLSFTILDIDNANNGNGSTAWRDRIAVTGTPSSVSVGSRIQGAGTENSPYRSSGTTQIDNSDPDGNVTLTWNGPLTSVTYRYFQIGAPTGTPHTGLSNISFTTIC
ncbi:hypothetical protein SAMN04489844_0810 [Nocardioides exalbidus]|uniref:Uncharacterized protein n=1 Tax=Nocardioides exalbidus TaxID=402596 RepID=A0A1H4L8Y0_9ACTN|nr:hypothetical protein [Nocardioides exalbidus]SEB67153.1 hypothetical protein SAMN04489844_0810 [Nocardioides exalbidus]